MEANNKTTGRVREFRRRTDIEKENSPALTGEDEFRIAIEAGGLGIFDYYPLSGELYWNATAREHFGLSSDAVVNYNVFLVGLHPDDREPAKREINRVLLRENGGRFRMEYRTVGIEDGVERRIEMSGQAFFNQWGEGVRFLGTTRDISGYQRPAEGISEKQPYRDTALTERTKVQIETILNATTDGVSITDRSGSVLHINDAGLALYGFNSIEEAKRPLQECSELFETRYRDGRMMPAEEWPRVRAARGEMVRNVEALVRRKDTGRTAIWNISSVPVMDSSGAVDVIVNTVRDLTEHRRTEERIGQLNRDLELSNAELDAERARWKGVVEGIAEEVWISDAFGNMSLINLPEETKMGLDPFSDKSLQEVLEDVEILNTDGQVRKPEDAPLLRSLKGEIVRGEEIMRHRRTGKLRYRQFSSAPIRDGWGAITGAVAIVRDTTEQKKTEEALRENEHRLRAIFDNAAMGIVEVNSEGRFTAANSRVRQILRLSEQELIGRTVHEMTAPEDRPISDRLNAELLEGRRDRLDYEKRYLRPDGSSVWVHVTVSPVPEVPGRFTRAVGTVEDITERKEAEQKMQRLVDELQRSNREFQQFAYVASHDLQEPLRTVSSYADLLAMKYKGKLDATADKYISFAVEGSHRMWDLINDLLAYSRVTTQGNPFLPVDVEEVLDLALANLRKAIKESGAAVTREKMPPVTGDPTQLTQVFQNLIANAVKFRKKDVRPQIRITAEWKLDTWIFGVHDNGIGIEPRFYDRIFTIFQRLHTAQEYTGTGVGLAICRKIVERHGGRIWVESRPGEGSAFYFTVPA